MIGSLLNNINDPFARFESEQSLVDFTHFDGTKAFDTMGFADSEGAVSGRAGTQEVDGNKLEEKELLREKREKRDKTNELMEFGAQLRQSRNESITVGGISLSIEEWKNVKDTLSDPAKRALVREQLKAEGKTDAEIDEGIYLANVAADIAIKKDRSIELTAEERAVEQKLENDPQAQQIARDAAKAVSKPYELRAQNDRSSSETQNADVSGIDNQPQFIVARSQTMDDESLVQENIALKNDMSVGGNPFADTRSASTDFNASALGLQNAAVSAQTAPEVKAPLPSLANV